MRAMTVVAVGLGVLLTLVCDPSRELQVGVVVEKVGPDADSAQGRLKPGDVLLRWRRGEASGLLVSPFDLPAVEVAESPRGQVVLEGERDGIPFSVPLPSRDADLEVRPHLPPRELSLYREVRDRLAAGRRCEMGARGRDLASDLAAGGRPLDAAWLLLRFGELCAEGHSWTEAEPSYRQALALAEKTGDAAPAAQIEERWGRDLEDLGRLDEALVLHRRALKRWQHRGGSAARLTAAYYLNDLAVAHQAHGDLAIAGDLYRRALAIRKELAPVSLTTAASYNNTGIVAGLEGRFADAERSFRQAQEIYQVLAPDSLAATNTLNNLAVLATKLGDLASAERDLGRAIDIRRRIEPGSPELAGMWNNLGELALRRGNLAAAERHFLDALDSARRHGPEAPRNVAILTNLAALALDRRDLAAARDYGRRALEIAERNSPDSLELAAVLDQLGILARRRGDAAEAKADHMRALEIRRRQAPNNLETAVSLKHLAILDLDRGDGGAAAVHLRQALALEHRLTPAATATGVTLCLLGEANALTGESAAAAGCFDQGLEILDRQSAESAAAARCHHRRARLYLRTGDTGQALASFGRAVDALEAQTRSLGGSYQTRSGFEADNMELYRDYLDLLFETGHPEQAFQVLERSRARSFLELLTRRDLTFPLDVPAELMRAKRQADAEYDRALAAIAHLTGEGEGSETAEQNREELEAALDRARSRQREAETRLRIAAPRLARLHHPEPLGPEAVGRILEPGTLLLSYSVGETHSLLFAVGPAGPAASRAASSALGVYLLPIGERELRSEVERFRDLLRPSRSEETIRAAGERLSGLLLAPVAERLTNARRLVVIPDGPLHNLPFASLPEPSPTAGSAGPTPWLVEGRPLSVVASATVLARLRARPHPRAPLSLIAFGDPAYPGAGHVSAPGPVLRSVLDRGLRLDPLPATRTEVESLSRIFANRSRVYLGREATEERAKALTPGDGLLHFACHGLVDPRHPLESALVLSLPPAGAAGRDNGLLQAWEILEQMHLDAELVTLSACDTGLGKELAGEGMLGLTRAFHFAGARTVLASLWAVDDRSTLVLMERFYLHLEQGASKDEALRSAQLELLHGSAGSSRFHHPFYWSAFQLFGDPS